MTSPIKIDLRKSKTMKQIVGLVGYIASGKSTVAAHFVDQGFRYFKLSDVVREECERRHRELNRKNLQDVGNLLREKYGPAYMAERTLKSAGRSKKIIIDGIRNPEEITYLREHAGFILGITAPQYVRLERYMDRLKKRREDGMSKAAFFRANKREQGVGEDSSGQQVKACLDMVDHTIKNNGSVDDLLMECEEVLQTNLFTGAIPVIG